MKVLFFDVGYTFVNEDAPAVIKALAQKYELGMKTVWIKQGFGALQKPAAQTEEPDYTIEKLPALLEIFI